MMNLTLDGLPDAIHKLLSFPQRIGWLFRGESKSQWKLIPKAGRPPFDGINDLWRFEQWRHQARAYCRDLPENEFECLAFAQHYGLPTRLLDFSMSSLVALYFACESNFDCEAALYAYLPLREHDPRGNPHLKEVIALGALNVRPVDRRIHAQHGRFVYFPKPTEELPSETVSEAICKKYKMAGIEMPFQTTKVKFLIAPKSKLKIIQQLFDIGITRSTFFPDLDGLSKNFEVFEQSNLAVQGLGLQLPG